MFPSTVTKGALKETHDFDAESPKPLVWDLDDEEDDDVQPPLDAKVPTGDQAHAPRDPEPALADVPGAPAEEAAAAVPLALDLRALTDEDIDRLWDWVREEPDTGKGFLGVAPTTSKQLHTMMSAVPATGIAYAIDHAALGHVGVLLLNPIVPTEHVAVTHLFLAKPMRARLPQVVGQLGLIASALHPALSFVVLTSRPEIARLYRGLGFETTYVLVRKPKE